MKKQKLYAFWKYDLCPYMLGGVVESFQSNGSVTVKGYPGMAFKPIAILPDIAGDTALAKLQILRSKYDEASKDLKRQYSDKARALVGLPKNK
jgi:hypothetical protein